MDKRLLPPYEGVRLELGHINVFSSVFHQLESHLNAFFIPNECKDVTVVTGIRRVV